MQHGHQGSNETCSDNRCLKLKSPTTCIGIGRTQSEEAGYYRRAHETSVLPGLHRGVAQELVSHSELLPKSIQLHDSRHLRPNTDKEEIPVAARENEGEGGSGPSCRRRWKTGRPTVSRCASLWRLHGSCGIPCGPVSLRCKSLRSACSAGLRPSIPLHERMHGQVVMRCRPFSGSETMRKCQSVVDIDSVSSQARPSPRGGDDATGSALLPIGNVRLC